ncbi:TPA: phage virion morphogenesis protein [Salmonella enterica]|nr:phage virion morphogenesis protein [Salmonella enterica]
MSIDLAVVLDIRRIQTAFKELGEMANDSDIPRVAAGALLSSTEQAFEKQADPVTGQHWAQWSDPYLAWREDHGYIPGQILTLHGDLARSITTDYGPDYALIGSPKIYAAIHQWGGTPGTRKEGLAALSADEKAAAKALGMTDAEYQKLKEDENA